MTIKDLITNRDYDCISLRGIVPEKFGGGDVFFGKCKSINGELISLDGDTYDEKSEVISFQEWSNDNIQHGLTVVCKEEWLIYN